MTTVTIDTDYANPAHLEELAALIRWKRLQRAARLAEMADKPALGWYREDLRRCRWVDAT